jgi:hypothetical protein
MRKTLGKPGFYQRRGQEPNFWVFSLRFGGVREVLRQDSVRPKFGSVDDQATIIGAMAMNQFRDSFVGYRQYWVLAQRAALLCRCASAIGFGGNRSIGFYCDTSLRLAFSPKRNILGGLLKFLAVGCGLNDIAPSANSSGT